MLTPWSLHSEYLLYWKWNWSEMKKNLLYDLSSPSFWYHPDRWWLTKSFLTYNVHFKYFHFFRVLKMNKRKNRISLRCLTSGLKKRAKENRKPIENCWLTIVTFFPDNFRSESIKFECVQLRCFSVQEITNSQIIERKNLLFKNNSRKILISIYLWRCQRSSWATPWI